LDVKTRVPVIKVDIKIPIGTALTNPMRKVGGRLAKPFKPLGRSFGKPGKSVGTIRDEVTRISERLAQIKQ